MRYLTDRKRAVGLGSAKSGVHHFWAMKVSSVALLILVPLFICSFGSLLGQPHEVVIAELSRPFPAIIIALTLIVGFKHFADGAKTMIEDYVHGTKQKYAIILMTCLSYALMVTGLFAVSKIAL